MKILYVYGNCSKSKYEELFRDSPIMISQQAQKYHSLLIEGLSDNQASVTCISGLPVNRQMTKKILFPHQTETINGVNYCYSGFINVPLIRHLCLFLASFRKADYFMKNNKNSVVICDVLSISSTFGAVLAAKRNRVKTMGIVTDVPGFLANGPNPFTTKVNWRILHLFDSYLFLTKEMNQLINPYEKPYLVLEGHVDQKMCQVNNTLPEKQENKIILYAGCLKRIYGVELLAKAFIHATMDHCELHIYGDGEYTEELKAICANYPQIYYRGVRPNDFIVEQEQKATLLVNPRPTKEAYTKYSFPSKNMEYMVSGTPVLTTKLAGMPKEYEKYVYLIEEETVEGLSQTLRDVLCRPPEELHAKGQKAKEFVLVEKNNKIQAEKIIHFLINNGGDSDADGTVINKKFL